MGFFRHDFCFLTNILSNEISGDVEEYYTPWELIHEVSLDDLPYVY